MVIALMGEPSPSLRTVTLQFKVFTFFKNILITVICSTTVMTTIVPVVLAKDLCSLDYDTYGLTATEAYNYITLHAEKIFIIDLREPSIFKTGHIQGARSINFLHNGFNYEIYKLDRNEIYLLYSDTDDDSFTTALMMLEMDFLSPYFLKDGLRSWRKQGLPTVK